MRDDRECVSRLRLYIDRFGGTSLPNQRKLARILGLSRAELVRAEKQLCNEGALVSVTGCRLRVKGRETVEPHTERREPGSSAERLYRRIKDRIVNGLYRAGDALPKNDHFRFEFSLSFRTISDVKNRLVAEQLAVRRGRRLLVGAPPPEYSSGHRGSLAVVTPLAHHWDSFCTEYRTRLFGTEFVGECRRHGIRLRNIPLGGPDGSGVPESADPGSQAFREAESLRPGLAGILLVAKRSLVPDTAGWIRLFGRLKTPVVWMDADDEGWAGPALGPRFFRCYVSEESACRLAVEYLWSKGHRNVAWPVRNPKPWQVARLRLLRKLGAERSPALQVVPMEWDYGGFHDESVAIPPLRTALDALLRCRYRRFCDRLHESAALLASGALRDTGFGEAATTGDPVGDFAAFTFMCHSGRLGLELGRGTQIPQCFRTVWTGLHLLPAFTNAAFTAIIAPNDAEGRVILAALQQTSIRPHDLSLLAFDGVPTYSYVPMNSVDFGFGDLGYQAFHATVGDVPVRCSRRGEIRGSVSVIDNGSVADRTGLP